MQRLHLQNVPYRTTEAKKAKVRPKSEKSLKLFWMSLNLLLFSERTLEKLIPYGHATDFPNRPPESSSTTLQPSQRGLWMLGRNSKLWDMGAPNICPTYSFLLRGWILLKVSHRPRRAEGFKLMVCLGQAVMGESGPVVWQLSGNILHQQARRHSLPILLPSRKKGSFLVRGKPYRLLILVHLWEGNYQRWPIGS